MAGCSRQKIVRPDRELVGLHFRYFDAQFRGVRDRKSTRLNSSHLVISYAVFCLKKKTKISVNTFVTTKITFANMLAEICEKIPGGDVDVVTNALGMDKRIGRAYLTGAIGYVFPCFPRDNVALSFIARQLGVEAALAETTDAMNRAIAKK